MSDETTDKVLEMFLEMSPEEREKMISENPEAMPRLLEVTTQAIANLSPLGMAKTISPGHRDLPHLDYLDARLTKAVRQVEEGESVFLRISMPPRSGKSVSTSEYLPLWVLKRHPDWKIGLISHSPALAASWGRQIRRMVELKDSGIEVARDAGAVTDWETTERGGVTSRSIGQAITGLGFKVLIVDDAVKDYADAASETKREALREWWRTTARTRIEPPSLVIVIGTRWHEDDFTGWVSTTGDPFEDIVFPAIATEGDVLGRSPGDPLYSPFIDETREEALARWKSVETSVGSYSWSALYQQSPSPAKGLIFHTDNWRYWTTDPAHLSRSLDGSKVDPNGKTILLDPNELVGGTWLDSWDLTFKGAKSSDYVVGQRWVRRGIDRYLIAQQRGQWGFTDQIAKIKNWAKKDNHELSPYGQHVHKIIIEDSANGPAVVSTLQDEIAGIKPIRVKGSKEERARAITPEIESGNVYFPHPSMPGYEWVQLLIDECRNFPTGKNDDQVDALSQALLELRTPGRGGIAMPGAGTSSSSLPLPGMPGGARGFGTLGGDRLAAARSMTR